MIFQKKIDGAFKRLHASSDDPQSELYEKPKGRGGEESLPEDFPELEKNDFLAMIIAALITILPVAILVLGGLCLIAYFLLLH